MKTIRLVQKLEKIQKLTLSEKRSTAAAFNNSTAVIGCITDYLSFEMQLIDKELSNPVQLYKNTNADHYVAFKLAEKARMSKLLNLLTEQTEVLDDDQSKDI